MKASEIHNKSMPFQAIIQDEAEEFYTEKFYITFISESVDVR